MSASPGIRSNSISQGVMKPLEVDVFTAARERMRYVFTTYDKVVVSYGRGKDSTCCLADRERLLKICNTAHRLGQRALGARYTSDWAVKGLP